MIWAQATCSLEQWDEIQDQFETLFIKLSCPQQMMLVAAPEAGASGGILFLSLPSPAFLSSFVDFEVVPQSELPSEASLLVGRNDEFDKYFNYPRRKAGPEDGRS